MYTSLARRFDLVETGGSDFHGTRVNGIEIGTGRGSLHVPDQLLQQLKECASAASAGIVHRLVAGDLIHGHTDSTTASTADTASRFVCFGSLSHAAGFVLYGLTAQQGLSWQDSGMLQWRILTGDYIGNLGLALAHPLYIAIGRVFSACCPLVRIWLLLNFCSGAGMAVTLANVSVLGWLLYREALDRLDDSRHAGCDAYAVVVVDHCRGVYLECGFFFSGADFFYCLCPQTFACHVGRTFFVQWVESQCA